MYSKLFASILDSSVWLEPLPTRVVWLTLLAAKDGEGFARFASVDNLARRAIVTPEEAEAAVRTLEAPDPKSSNPDHEGRRIERVPGGWMVLNAKLYDDMVKREDERRVNRERVRRHRANAKQKPSDPAAPAVSAREELLQIVPYRPAWEAEMDAAVQGMHGKPVTLEQIEAACRDYLGNGARDKGPNMRQFRRYLQGIQTAAATEGVAGRPPNGSRAAQLVTTIRGFVTQQGQSRFIPIAKVRALGPDVERAYDAVGGATRFLEVTADKLSFLIRDFSQQLPA